MSAMLRIAPPSSMKATESGTSVSFIHMQWSAVSSNTNTMPALVARDWRCIRPCARAPALSATSARIRCMPVESSVTGRWAAAGTASSAAIRKRAARTAEKEKAGAMPCLVPCLGDLLLLLVALLLAFCLLAFALLHLLLRLFLGRVLFLVLGDGLHANCRKHRGDDHRQQLRHFILLVFVIGYGVTQRVAAGPRKKNARRADRLTDPTATPPCLPVGPPTQAIVMIWGIPFKLS